MAEVSASTCSRVGTTCTAEGYFAHDELQRNSAAHYVIIVKSDSPLFGQDRCKEDAASSYIAYE